VPLKAYSDTVSALFSNEARGNPRGAPQAAARARAAKARKATVRARIKCWRTYRAMFEWVNPCGLLDFGLPGNLTLPRVWRPSATLWRAAQPFGPAWTP